MACGVYASCLKAPTTPVTIDVGDSFTWEGNWSQDVPMFTLCHKTKARVHAQQRMVPFGLGWQDISGATDLSTSDTNPITKTRCGANTACGSCTTNKHTITVTASSAAAGNDYEVRCRTTSSSTPTSGNSTTQDVTVNPLPAGGNFRLTLMGCTKYWGGFFIYWCDRLTRHWKDYDLLVCRRKYHLKRRLIDA